MHLSLQTLALHGALCSILSTPLIMPLSCSWTSTGPHCPPKSISKVLDALPVSMAISTHCSYRFCASLPCHLFIRPMTSPYCLLMIPQYPSQRWSLTTSVSKLNAEDGEGGCPGWLPHHRTGCRGRSTAEQRSRVSKLGAHWLQDGLAANWWQTSGEANLWNYGLTVGGNTTPTSLKITAIVSCSDSHSSVWSLRGRNSLVIWLRDNPGSAVYSQSDFWLT